MRAILTQNIKKNLYRFEKSKQGNAIIKLIKSLDGPQEIQIEVWFHVKGKDGVEQYILGHNIFTVVTKHPIQ